MKSIDSPYGEVPNGWQLLSLIDVCINIGGIQTGPFGSQLHQKDYVSDGTPIITVEHLGENRILHDDLPRVTEIDKNRLNRYSLKEGDIVFSRVGSVDRRALVRKEEDGWLFSGRCLRIRPDHNKVNPSYLSWFFGLPSFKEHVRRIAVGATMPSLNTELLSSIPVFIPPLIEQDRIVNILDPIESKIELNRRMNRTLEEMARATFKSWFVDFDPVRAKAEGRSTGLPADLAALFPDSFEDSPLGEIPKGWRVSTVGDEVKVVGGGTPSTKESSYWVNGKFSWTTPKDLAGLSSPILIKTDRQITKEGLNQISSGLLPKGTVLLSSRAPIGYLAIANVPTAINQGFIGMVCDQALPNIYILLWTQQHMEVIKARANGTTFQEISKVNFRPILLVVPNQSILDSFLTITKPLFDRITSNLLENNNLEEIRDSILPKLMSG